MTAGVPPGPDVTPATPGHVFQMEHLSPPTHPLPRRAYPGGVSPAYPPAVSDTRGRVIRKRSRRLKRSRGWGSTCKPMPPNYPPAVSPGVGSAMTFRLQGPADA